MDFSYPDSHEDLKKLCTEIFKDFSNAERYKQLEVNGPYFDSTVWNKLQETGLLSASFPSSLGGMDMDFSATALIAELLGETVLSIPYIPTIISAALPLLGIASGDPVVKEALTRVAAGDSLLVSSFLEPGNEDPLNPLTSVSESADGFVLQGIKHCVPYAAQADSILLSGDLDGDLWLGLVKVDQGNCRLVEQFCTANEPQYQLQLEQASGHCIATGDAARKILQQSLAMTSAAYCSMAVGLCHRMTKISAEYTSQREQFGVPIATFQAVAHRLASCYIDTECLHIITLKAVSDINQGDYDHESLAMAKTWCGDACHRVSQAAQHVHGGIGVDRDYHLFRYCLWAKQLELSLGCSKVHIDTLANRLEQKYLAASAS